jgi:hypothetical protein
VQAQWRDAIPDKRHGISVRCSNVGQSRSVHILEQASYSAGVYFERDDPDVWFGSSHRHGCFAKATTNFKDHSFLVKHIVQIDGLMWFEQILSPMAFQRCRIKWTQTALS